MNLQFLPGEICCANIKVTLQNGPDIHQGSRSGKFIISTSDVNGRRYFTSIIGEQAIWYCKEYSSWVSKNYTNLM